jgi:hypothetical protein
MLRYLGTVYYYYENIYLHYVSDTSSAGSNFRPCPYSLCMLFTRRNYRAGDQDLKVHKRENFLGSDLEICTFS